VAMAQMESSVMLPVRERRIGERPRRVTVVIVSVIYYIWRVWNDD
jgi:hypothetical protein